MVCYCYREYKNKTLVICNCMDCYMVNKYITNDIMNKNLCPRCDSQYTFLSYLKYTNQLSYDSIIVKKIRFSKLQDLFFDLIEDDVCSCDDFNCCCDNSDFNYNTRLNSNIKLNSVVRGSFS